MNFKYEAEQEDFRPRLIIWELRNGSVGDKYKDVNGEQDNPLTTKEAMLVLESIARIARPIVVLNGTHLLLHSDLFEIVEYGHTLGLKMIVEVPPEDITQDILQQYSVFGPRVFRVLVDNCIQEDMDTRFRRTKEYYTLDRCIRLLKSSGFEVHLGATVTKPEIRPLAFEHDFAFRKSARGLYCHLHLDKEGVEKNKRPAFAEENIEEFIEAIAKMKRYSPDTMYFSPQCVQYGFVGYTKPGFDSQEHGETEKGFEWKHLCLGGKRFAYITHNGEVQICSGLSSECGNLRMTDFDFKEIWENSEVFQELRDQSKSCTETREMVKKEHIQESSTEKVMDVEYLP